MFTKDVSGSTSPLTAGARVFFRRLRGAAESHGDYYRRLRCGPLLALCICGATALSGAAVDKDSRPPSPDASHVIFAAQAESPRTLEPGSSVEGELTGEEACTYEIILSSGQLLDATLTQLQTDLSATLYRPDGGQAALFDYRWYGPEPIQYLAEATGKYRIVVRQIQKTSPRGPYRLRVAELRAPRPEDKPRIEALKASTEGKALIEQGGAQSLRSAKGKYEEALPIWRAAGDRSGEAQALNGLGFLSGALGAPPKALEYYEQALAIRREIGDRDGEGETLHGIAAMQSALGRKAQALEIYNRALPLRQASGYRVGEATTLGNIGQIHFSLGEMPKAIDYYQRSLPLWRAAGHRAGEASAYIGLGSIYGLTGEKQRALDYMLQALAVSRGADDRRGQGYALFNLGKLYADLGEREKALESCSQAVALFRAVGDRGGEANTLNSLGALTAASGDRPAALEYFNQALSIWRGSSDRYGEAYALLSIGRLMDESGEKRKALEQYNSALSLFRGTKNPRGEALTLNNLGLLIASLGESRQGLDAYRLAIPLWRELGDKGSEAASLANLARIERDLGDLDGAKASIESALALVESLRGKIASQQLRASYFASTQNYHEFYIDLLMRLHGERPGEGYDALALQASEQARARGLLELLTEAHADVDRGVNAELLERERALQRRLNEKADYQFRLLNERYTREQMEAAKLDLNARVEDLRQVETEIRNASPVYAALKYPMPIGLPEIRGLLDPETVLLEYSLGEKRSHLWVVTSTTFDSYELPPRAEIEALARQTYDLLSSAETGEQLRARLARPATKSPEALLSLSRILLGPALARLRRKRLLIVADGALQYLPFAVFPAPEREGGGQPLIVEHEISNLPSASTLSTLRREMAGRAPAPKAVAVIADPVFDSADPRVKHTDGYLASADSSPATRQGSRQDLLTSAREVGAAGEVQPLRRLEFSRAEAETIYSQAGAAGSFKALDFAASRAALLRTDLSQFRILHFATHGLLNSQHPELSGVALSLVDEQGRPQDGFLRLHDIYNLKLGADLVVLSACKTGLGKEIKGEGLVGLTRGFLYAGSPRVVASLWKVDDRATAELMKLFYQQMLSGGLRPAAALRMAQIDLWRQKRWAAPYYWAAFTLQGEWK
jgi:CHAT domain-containing protein/tetratricopeptide (TPR) repeat protein